jgi:hypothetical protein
MSPPSELPPLEASLRGRQITLVLSTRAAVLSSYRLIQLSHFDLGKDVWDWAYTEVDRAGLKQELEGLDVYEDLMKDVPSISRSLGTDNNKALVEAHKYAHSAWNLLYNSTENPYQDQPKADKLRALYLRSLVWDISKSP